MALTPRSALGIGWRIGHPWNVIYRTMIERPAIPRAFGRLALGADIRNLHTATEELGLLAVGSSVLDIPCGTGIALRAVRPQQRLRYVAADIARPMLDSTADRARQMDLAVELRQADIGALPFADGEFDVCISLTGLHCFPDPRGAVSELVRALRPGGRLLGSFVRSDGPKRNRALNAAGRLVGIMGPSCSAEQLRRWLANDGIDDVDIDIDGGIVRFSATKPAARRSS